MKTFLKVLLFVLLGLLAIKLLPFVLVPVFVAGISLLVVALVALLVTLLAVLSPIWIPVLAVIGLIALIRSGRAVA